MSIHLIITALHHHRYEKQYPGEGNTTYQMHHLRGNFLSSKAQALEAFKVFFTQTVNNCEQEISQITILMDFNLGYSCTQFTPLPELNEFINSFVNAKKQPLKAQNKITEKLNTTATASSNAIPHIPVNFYFDGAGGPEAKDSTFPQISPEKAAQEYGTGKGKLLIFLASTRSPSRNISHTGFANLNIGSPSPTTLSSPAKETSEPSLSTSSCSFSSASSSFFLNRGSSESKARTSFTVNSSASNSSATPVSTISALLSPYEFTGTPVDEAEIEKAAAAGAEEEQAPSSPLSF